MYLTIASALNLYILGALILVNIMIKKDNYNSKMMRIILLLGVPFVILMITWKLNTICFETNDDYSLMSIVAGFRTGTPSPNMMFCNIIWGWGISVLYRITEIVPWYTVAFLSVIYLSLVVVYDTCMYIFRKSVIKGTIFFIGLYLCVLCWYTTILEFTTIPAYAGTAAILLMAEEKEQSFERIINRRFILFIPLVCCAVLLRTDVGYLFTFALVLYGVWLKFWYKVKTDKYIISGIIIQGITWFINFIYIQFSEWKDYWDYNSTRAQWADHPSLNYSQNPELYKSIGWSENFYNLARNWFYLDEHFNKESLDKLNEAYSSNADILNGYSLRELLSRVFCGGVPGFQIAFGLLILYAFAMIIITKEKRDVLTIVLFSAINFVLLFNVAISGRLIFRVQFSIMLMFLIPAIFIVLFGKQDRCSTTTYRLMLKGLCTSILMVMITISLSSEKGLYKNMAEYSKWHTGQQTTVFFANELAMEFPNSYFIYDFNLALAGNPFSTYPEQKPNNIRYWGGWEAYSPIDKQQLNVNGFEKFYLEDFFNERVFLVSLHSSTLIQDLLVPYMEEKFPGCYLEEVLQNERFIVYQFRK